MQKGFIFDIQRFSTVNGPGIRTALFFKGCPLRCAWCHNPESQSSKSQLLFTKSKCIGCGRCVRECKNAVHALLDGKHLIDFQKCIVCGDCVKSCYRGALQISGREASVMELMNLVLRDKVYYDLSGGGVTFTGGEPTIYAGFIAELSGLLRGKGVHTALDTCGYAPRNVFEKLAPVCDLFLYDIKVMNEERHKKYTGVSNRKILDNLVWLIRGNSNVRIRLPLIPGVNDDENNIIETSRFLTTLGIGELDLLPYHEYGKNKAEGIGRIEEISFQKPDAEMIDRVMGLFRANGIEPCLL